MCVNVKFNKKLIKKYSNLESKIYEISTFNAIFNKIYLEKTINNAFFLLRKIKIN